jgi:hypothetical protein
MLRLLADEDFDNDIVRGILRRLPGIDLVRVQDVGLSGSPDLRVLEWAADESRILLTHDVNTLVAAAYQRVANSEPMPGVLAVPQDLPISRAIANLVLLAECSLDGEWEGQVRYLPLR